MDKEANHFAMNSAFASEWCERAKRPATVLIVDDDDNDRLLFRSATEQFQCEVIEAANGSEALEIMKQCPDLKLIVLDEAMPGLSGLDTFRKLRSAGSRSRIVFLTGHVHKLIEEMSQIGFATILSKSALVRGTALQEMMAVCGYLKKEAQTA